ncbi:MAG TPA: hypothetical protein VLG46_04660, partial [Anaerolineae bacterium]|nr:hypothetical protein [Anaerolineae bacterium]
AVVSVVTVLAMFVPLALELAINEHLPVASSLALGAFAGFVVAAINWFRLGLPRKGLLHLLISPVIFLIIPLGIPLLLTFVVVLFSGGSVDRGLELSETLGSMLVLPLEIAVAALVIVYLNRMTKRDVERLQARGITVWYASFLPPLGIAAVSMIGMFVAITVAGQIAVASRQNHIYCELLQPGMTEQEVSQALNEIGAHTQLKVDDLFPLPDGVSYYRTIFWDGVLDPKRYPLGLFVGYDTASKLVWKGRYWTDWDPARSPLTSGVDTISCPWTLQQSLTAR